MRPEEVEDAEFSRTTSDRELKKGGASMEKGFIRENDDITVLENDQLHLEQGQIENLRANAEEKLGVVERLEGGAYMTDREKFGVQAVELRNDYKDNVGNVRVKSAAEIAFGRGALDHYKNHPGEDRYHDADSEEEWKQASRLINQKGWDRVIVFVDSVKKFSRDYGLSIPMLNYIHAGQVAERMNPEEVLALVDQARSAALYEAKEHLGKIK